MLPVTIWARALDRSNLVRGHMVAVVAEVFVLSVIQSSCGTDQSTYKWSHCIGASLHFVKALPERARSVAWWSNEGLPNPKPQALTTINPFIVPKPLSQNTQSQHPQIINPLTPEFSPQQTQPANLSPHTHTHERTAYITRQTLCRNKALRPSFV